MLRNHRPPLTSYTMFPVVFPFFEGVDPPPTFPIPTLHTRLDLPHRVVLIAHSILSPRSVARRNAIVHVAPPTDSRRSSSPAARAPDRAAINHGRFSPEPEPVTTIQSTPASTSGYDTDSDLTSISGVSSNHITPDSTPTRRAPSKLKSKPKGEVGRPGRGGYTLSKAVHFDARTLGAIRVCRVLPSPSHSLSLIPFRNACTSCAKSFLIPARVSNLKMRTDSGKYGTR
jgi:hypothetical protein